MNDEAVVAQVDRAPAKELEVGGSSPPAAINIKDFEASCTVCKMPVPKQRTSMRTRYTCSPKCLKVLQDYRKFLAKTMFCKNCQRPCTPEETKMFRAWRKSMGQLREGPGRPVPEPKMREIRAGIHAALDALGNVNSDNFQAQAKTIAELLEKLLDGGGGKSTLAASGHAPEGEG